MAVFWALVPTDRRVALPPSYQPMVLNTRSGEAACGTTCSRTSASSARSAAAAWVREC